MSTKILSLTENLHNYLLSVGVRDSEILQELRAENNQHPMAVMQIAPEQGQFMGLLVQLLGVKKALEVGVFTGYSSLIVAMAMPADGQLIACDISDEYTAMARKYWEKAGVAHKVDLRIAPALDTLDQLIEEGHSNSFDFAFIDADKSNYDNYYERALQLVRPGGLIAVDNVLWSGRVAEPTEQQDNRTQRIHALNEKIHGDGRVSMSLVPMADGLMLAMKRA
ncbi:class I SAM-dependent methyltransferase [Leptolyngbya cf. ectocarpi LEGE 11479]|uniref:Class I SAM-dependent methyltransferase n=1 Tax=Leptolyngbya cf. ectocarpi LEGE 11479 TaxID=1828722 RepID=A0A928ZYG5_LEPEC|nr:class I SAM-dependent methyltransferase [Leptolyngbya ectocarpi]MBE9069748.1 class I SAM-dependent methyltransferase [Leptolyngbya cf. ectocarpi LEGE 11479]